MLQKQIHSCNLSLHNFLTYSYCHMKISRQMNMIALLLKFCHHLTLLSFLISTNFLSHDCGFEFRAFHLAIDLPESPQCSEMTLRVGRVYCMQLRLCRRVNINLKQMTPVATHYEPQSEIKGTKLAARTHIFYPFATVALYLHLL